MNFSINFLDFSEINFTFITLIGGIFLILLGLFIIDIIVFIFNFMTYVAYNDKVKQLKKGRNSTLDNKNLWKIYMFAGV